MSGLENGHGWRVCNVYVKWSAVMTVERHEKDIAICLGGVCCARFSQPPTCFIMTVSRCHGKEMCNVESRFIMPWGSPPT